MNSKNLKVSVGRLMVIIIMLIIVIVGGTFAWFTYSSRQSALVLTIGDINDTQIRVTPYQIRGTMIPVGTYTSGVYSEIEITSDQSYIALSLFYKINNLDLIIIDNGLAYTIVDMETGNIVAEDYFYNLIDTSQEITSEVIILDDIIPVSNYRVYLWLDSSTGEQSEVQNSILDVELNASVIYENYVVNLDTNGGSLDSTLFTTVGETQYTVPADGTYKLEVWGAQGGSANTILGGYGGYSVGTVHLDENDILYINVGGQGEDGKNTTDTTTAGGYNGGGTGYVGTAAYYVAGGGGATHLATISGKLSELEEYKNDILIVAGGGGGVSYNISSAKTLIVGHGGGYIGVSSEGQTVGGTIGYASGGTQIGAGEEGSAVGTFGQGASIKEASKAGGGGGYYGGNTNVYSAGGGSGYIGNSLLTDKAMYCYSCTTSSDASTLTYSTTNVSSSPVVNYAKSGDGAARITMLSKTVTNGSTYGTLPTPTREGYTFLGWNTASDGSGETITDSTIVNLSSTQTILYAIWEEIKTYTISYNANGGSGAPSAQTKYHDTTLTLSSTKPTRSGYAFAGWSTSSSATSATYSAGGSYTANASVTLYAVWKQITTTSGNLEWDIAPGQYEGAYTIVPYSVSYNPVTNQSTVKFSTLTCRIWCGSYQTTTLSATITVTATDSGKSASSSLSTSDYGNSSSDGYHLSYPSVSPVSVIVQHSSTVGSKSVKISSSSSMKTHTGWTGKGSGSKTVTVGTYSG